MTPYFNIMFKCNYLKTFKFFNIKLFKILYPTFIRPYLEFATPVWNVLSKESTRKLEGVQRRATKMVIELRSMEYEERLKSLGLTTLEERRKRGDLIQIYKIINGMEVVDIDMGIGNNYRTVGGIELGGMGTKSKKNYREVIL